MSKYKVCLFIISFLAVNILIGQEEKFSFGLSITPWVSDGIANKSLVNSDYYSGIETMKFGYSVSLNAELDMNKWFGLSFEAGYSLDQDKSSLFPWDANRGLPARSYLHKHGNLDLGANMYYCLTDNLRVFVGICSKLRLSSKTYYLHEGIGDPFELSVNEHSNGKIGASVNSGLNYGIILGPTTLCLGPYVRYDLIKPMKDYTSDFGSVPIDFIPSRRYLNYGLRLTLLI